MDHTHSHTINLRWLTWLGIAALLVCSSGCSLFVVTIDESSSSASADSSALPSIAVPRDALQLEIVFVERPAGHPLLGAALWNEIDQIGALDPEVRHGLRQNGLRVGHVSSTPPEALQTLLGLAAEIPDRTGGPALQQLVGRRVTLTSGGETIIQVSPNQEQCRVTLQSDNEQETQEYHHARGVFRVKAERVQDGWIRVSFQPEVHHGYQQLRHTATANGWQLDTRQAVDPFFQQQFEVTLNVGEMVVITSDGDRSDSLGHRFFRPLRVGEKKRTDLQRLLVVRLAGMRNLRNLSDR